MCNSSSSVLVLNRTSPSLLHTFVAYTTQRSIAIQHNGNSFLHQHIPRKRLRASSCLKRDCVSITLRFWNAAIVSLDPIPFCSHTKHIRNASWGNGDYVLVYHDVFTVVYFLFVPAFKFHRPYLDKDTYFSCYCLFLGLKGSNHVAGCVFCTFFAILSSNRLVHSLNN